MRVLHAAPMRQISSGIINQMKWEHDAAQDLNLPWEVKIFVPNDFKFYADSIIIEKSNKDIKINSNFQFRREYYDWLLKQESQFDCFVLRYNNFDFQQLSFIRKIKKPVYLIHHTLELPELKSEKTIKSSIQYILEQFIGKYSIKLAKGNIGVTNEIFEYENARVNYILKNKLIYPNGIFYGDNDLDIVDERGAIPEIVFIASFFYEWHGLDLLLNDLKNSQEKFVLHIIGDITESDRSIACRDSRVILHGHLDEEQIQEILKKSWIGLASFALYRKGMKEACTLKVREYLKSGLPVYSGHDDIFAESFLYYYKGDVLISSIVEYAKKMRVHSKNDVSESSKRYISKKNLVNVFYTKLSRVFL
ncbi:glycosyltransferase [Acinetobacter gerneri]|uniref:Glycosyltransferase n=1 Tax=Acinetobacter gerneri TaxID=202952 RepID=A0AAW8JJG6_9GAMM|nr:glycosyltransferase [Acinetobacter gerneri]MDQ9010700.1 glycosyltransferase [Acinetobacter gerneri]MDQ9014868.1 glycosyltransferase [Acinetobacter gerneri]MDQ9026070.1 glycosyltransferase [Acinetobacter gerneri]MDQ9053320.1 glycosyltransferase [Acinetobacter gerneri]MDQ9060939.1 glycosyltransferase [Acinetobacter gerneri]